MFVLRTAYKPTLFVRKHIPSCQYYTEEKVYIYFYRTGEVSVPLCLQLSAGSARLRKVWVSPVPLAAAASRRHLHSQKSRVGTSPNPHCWRQHNLQACVLLSHSWQMSFLVFGVFLHLFHARKLPVLDFFSKELLKSGLHLLLDECHGLLMNKANKHDLSGFRS